MGYCTRGIRFHTRKKCGIFCVKSGRKSTRTLSETVKNMGTPTKICIVPWGTMFNFYMEQRGGTTWPDKWHSLKLGRTCRNHSTLPPPDSNIDYQLVSCCFTFWNIAHFLEFRDFMKNRKFWKRGLISRSTCPFYME